MRTTYHVIFERDNKKQYRILLCHGGCSQPGAWVIRLGLQRSPLQRHLLPVVTIGMVLYSRFLSRSHFNGRTQRSANFGGPWVDPLDRIGRSDPSKRGGRWAAADPSLPYLPYSTAMTFNGYSESARGAPDKLVSLFEILAMPTRYGELGARTSSASGTAADVRSIDGRVLERPTVD